MFVAYIFRNDVNVVIMVFITMFLCQFVFRYFAYNYVLRKFDFNKYKIENEVKNLSDESLKAYKKESLSLSFNSAVSGAGANFSGIIIFNRLGAADTAIYSLAITFADFAMTLIASTLNRTMFILSKMTKNNDEKNKINYIKSLYKKYFIYAFILMTFTMICLPFVYKYLFIKY
jgi:O-antigen/teichoic acid export membrane protein